MKKSLPFENGYQVHANNLDESFNPYPDTPELAWARKDWLAGWLTREKETNGLDPNDIAHRITALMG
ncbi:hypothetical protein VIBNIFTn2_120138 [Vibrio nigripulchritudo FTn2]|uniref:hypothetical protein n=1 Tax=Vibrio nigripulchritudo TaxID=28173 RepID=UPI0003B192C4|nr:hypothetical protein [Vibrio nigripulchritudo]CCN40156.1 hypothetical protein VIBNIFTn2_120138 [Vibrio nigripulchritudo FTn2]